MKNKTSGLSARTEKLDIKLLHKRPRHASIETIKQTVSLGYDDCKRELEDCSVCLLARYTRLPFNFSTSRAEVIFHLIHVHVCGPYGVQTYDGRKNLLLLWMIIPGYVGCIC